MSEFSKLPRWRRWLNIAVFCVICVSALPLCSYMMEHRSDEREARMARKIDDDVRRIKRVRKAMRRYDEEAGQVVSYVEPVKVRVVNACVGYRLLRSALLLEDEETRDVALAAGEIDDEGSVRQVARGGEGVMRDESRDGRWVRVYLDGDSRGWWLRKADTAEIKGLAGAWCVLRRGVSAFCVLEEWGLWDYAVRQGDYVMAAELFGTAAEKGDALRIPAGERVVVVEESELDEAVKVRYRGREYWVGSGAVRVE